MHTDTGLPLPLAMLLIFGAAKLLSEVFERLRQPGIIGEIVAGVLIGPSVLGWIHPNELLTSLSELGVMFLLFRVGLEVKSSEFLSVGKRAAVVAAAGVAVPFAAGWALTLAWGYGGIESIFVGAALVATSVGITAQVLAAKGWLHENSARIILAAAVIDDVLGLIVLAIVSGVSKGRLDPWNLGLTALLPVLFTIAVAKWGAPSVRKLAPRVESSLQAAEGQFHLAIVLLFALSVVALKAGVAAIVGAFLAGMALSEHVAPRVHHLVAGTAELMVPFFLAGIGFHIDLAQFRDPGLLLFSVLVLLVAVATKLIGCGAGAWPLGRAEALRIGVGMSPRGEVGMVVAQIGLAMGAISQPIYGAVVFAALGTTLVAPPLLNWAYRGVPPRRHAEPATYTAEAV